MTFHYLRCILYVGDWFGLSSKYGTVLSNISHIWGFSFFKLFIWWSVIDTIGTHSVSSPLRPTRYSTLFYYRPRSFLPSVKELLNDNSIKESLMHPAARAVAQVCCLYFCRVGEVLSLKYKDVLHPDRVVCIGSKRGSSYLLYLPGLSSQLVSLEDIPSSLLLFPISYLKCYRSFVRAGIRFCKASGKNTMRTHAPRYQVNSLSKKGFEIDVLSSLLHHKSKSSILYYLSNKGGPCGKD